MVFISVVCSLLLEVDGLFVFCCFVFIIIDYHFHLKMIRMDFPPLHPCISMFNFVHNDDFCVGRKVFAAGG